MSEVIAHEVDAALLDDLQANIVNRAFGSAAAFRNAILGDSTFIISPALKIAARGSEEEGRRWLAQLRADMMVELVRSGRMVDFGELPNEVMKRESKRNHVAFEDGAFTHPFAEWLAVARWEGGANAYFVTSYPDGSCVVVEIYGFNHPLIGPSLLLSDMVRILRAGDGVTSADPFPTKLELSEEDNKLRVGNIADPLVCFLSLLANASVEVRAWTPEPKLNRARAKAGKPIIPPHTIVDSSAYVTWLKRGGGQHGAPQGGHHASPVAHWRRGHSRVLASGRVVPVAASHVNFRDKELVRRLFYSFGRKP